MTASKKKSERIRILVPTDLSPASRAGVRYAIQWSLHQPADLVFCYVVNILKPPSWSDNRYNAYAKSMRARYMRELRRFVTLTSNRMGVHPRNASHVLLESISVDIALVDYCPS
ncbi:universal stress protein [Puia sp. P3]|uniref:universal stress protein n=1 Tax=Puia sp. P3 TaxID=3423952 RepID=UPI003D672EC9